MLSYIIVEILVAITWPISLEQSEFKSEDSEINSPFILSKELLQLHLQNKLVICEARFITALVQAISECIAARYLIWIILANTKQTTIFCNLPSFSCHLCLFETYWLFLMYCCMVNRFK